MRTWRGVWGHGGDGEDMEGEHGGMEEIWGHEGSVRNGDIVRTWRGHARECGDMEGSRSSEWKWEMMMQWFETGTDAGDDGTEQNKNTDYV